MAFTDRWFTRLIEDFDGIIDTSDGTYKRLLLRMQDDLLQLRDEIAKNANVRGDLEAAKMQLNGFVRENEELKTKLASLQSANLRKSAFAARITADEAVKLEASHLLDQFLLDLQENKFVNAIKTYRWVFGSGLKEAKDRVEVIRGDQFR